MSQVRFHPNLIAFTLSKRSMNPAFQSKTRDALT
jgi:hypothetical protein